MQNNFGDNNVCNSISLFLTNFYFILFYFFLHLSISLSLLCHVTSYIHLKLNATEYSIAGNFRGIQFSRLTGKPQILNPQNKSLNTHSRYSDRPSSKINRSRNLCIQPFRENWIPRKLPYNKVIQDYHIRIKSIFQDFHSTDS